jgi:hypothetical protein
MRIFAAMDAPPRVASPSVAARVPGQALKPAAAPSDPPAMGTRDLSCPICQADLPLDGDEKAGDEVICSYCGAPSRIITGKKDEGLEAEEEEY